MPCPSDEFGEIPELLRRFAFLAWRHGRVLHSPKVAQAWVERFDQCFREPSVDRECVEYFLATVPSDRSAQLNESFLQDAEGIFSICSLARQRRNSVPVSLDLQLASIDEWISSHFRPGCFADERNYFLGQLEFSRGVCARWSGDRAGSLARFDAAENYYRQTLEAETGLAEVELGRVNTWYEMGRHLEVLKAVPPTSPLFARSE